MTTIQFQSIIDGVSKKKDGTLSIKLGTQELNKDDTAQIFDMGNKEIWVAFCEVPMDENDLNIPEILTEFKSDKTPSQRLRDVLFVFWEKNKKGQVEWEIYYRSQIDKIIDYVKDKLE